MTSRGIGRILAHVGEDVVPDPVPTDVPDQEHHAGQGLVEHQGLDVEPDPGDDRLGHGPDPGVVGVRRDDRGRAGGSAEKPAQPEKDKRSGHPARADAERAEGDDLGIGREAGQPAEDAHEDGHRQGEDRHGRDEDAEDAESFEDRDAFVDEQIGQQQDLVHQEDEHDEQEADEEGRDDLAQDVPVDEARHRDRI